MLGFRPLGQTLKGVGQIRGRDPRPIAHTVHVIAKARKIERASRWDPGRNQVTSRRVDRSSAGRVAIVDRASNFRLLGG